MENGKNFFDLALKHAFFFSSLHKSLFEPALEAVREGLGSRLEKMSQAGKM
jgi:hypothetical protein